MTAERVAHVRYRLERARATLEEAKALFGLGLLHGAVNRLYYGCFYKDLRAFDPDEVRQWSEQATAFVAEITKLTEQLLATDAPAS